mgnify:CR=1 FL=1
MFIESNLNINKNFENPIEDSLTYKEFKFEPDFGYTFTYDLKLVEAQTKESQIFKYEKRSYITIYIFKLFKY